MNTAPSLAWDHNNPAPILQVQGCWTLEQRKPELNDVWRAGGRLPERITVQVAVAAWDSSLLAVLRRLQRLADEQDVVPACGGYLHRAFCNRLSSHVLEIEIAFGYIIPIF